MASYRELEPGLFELGTPGGPLTVTASEDELRANGHIPESLSVFAPGAQAMAQNGGAGGAPNAPATAQDFGPSFGGSPAQKLDQDIIDGAPSNPVVQKLSPNTETVNMTRETQPMRAGEPIPKNKGLRGGGEVVQAGEGGGGAAPEQRARFVKTPGRDIRAGFTIQKTGASPEDYEAAEESEADASIERKLGAQGIAGRHATQTEELSAEMGRQIRREGVALRQQEERNRARAEDYERRQAAIEKERDDVAKMNVSVGDFIDDGSVASVIGAIAMLAAAPGAAYSGGENDAIRAIESHLDRKVAQAKEHLGGKENELDRLTKLYGSPAEAEAEYRDRQRLLIQSMGQKMATDAGATDAADNLRMQFADWDDQRAQSRLARQEALAGKVSEQWQYMPERVVQVGGPRAMKPEARERAVRLQNGQYAFARSKQDAEKVQSQLTAGNAVLNGIGKLRSIMADGQPWDPDKRAAAQSIAAGLALDGKNADQAGALDAGTQEIMSKMFSDPSEMFNPAAVSRLDAAAQRQQGKTSGLVRDYLHVDPEATTPVSAARPQTVRHD